MKVANVYAELSYNVNNETQDKVLRPSEQIKRKTRKMRSSSDENSTLIKTPLVSLQ